MSELDLDAIEANARHWDHLVRDDPETTLALVAEVRRLRALPHSRRITAEDEAQDDW